MKAKVIMIVLLGTFVAILAVGLILSGKLVVFDLCEEKAKDCLSLNKCVKFAGNLLS